MLLLAVVIAAVIYFKPPSTKVAVQPEVEAVEAAPRQSKSAPMVTPGNMAGRFKTGPNAQTELTLKRSW